MKLLFIEDDDIIRNSLRDYLNTIFDDIYEVSDGKDAFKTYLEVKPDVILLDINLPSIDGITIAKDIRRTDKKTIIIILSAREDRKTLLEATTLGLTKYLLKPIQRKELKESLLLAISKVKVEDYSDKTIKLISGFIWNLEEKELFHPSMKIQLTKMEISLFVNFCLKSKNIVNYEDMYFQLYNNMEYNENKLRMLIKRLRLKTHHDIIQNIYGLGYKFNIEK
jgi:two-component system, OmpR family, response regulator VanR